MEISADAIAWIQREEGFSEEPYTNLLGRLAIGHGHTYEVDASTQPVTAARAAELLREDLVGGYGVAVDRLGLALNQNQFDAICSFVYQFGVEALSPSGPFGSHLHAADWAGAADALLLYDRVEGRVVPALRSRRTLERALMLSPAAPAPNRLAVLTRDERAVADRYEREQRGPDDDRAMTARLREELGVLRQYVWIAAVRGRRSDGTPTEPGWDREQRTERYAVLRELSGGPNADPRTPEAGSAPQPDRGSGAAPAGAAGATREGLELTRKERGMLKLGKQPQTYDSRDIRYGDVRPASVALPTAPRPSGGSGTDFADWLMLGNGPCDDGTVDPSWAAYEGAGDCAWAGPAHETMEACRNAGRPVPRFTCLNILQQYSAYCGYNLQTGASDAGSQVRDVFRWRQVNGLTDADGNVHKIGTYLALEPGNTEQLWEALWLFEAVGVGLKLPASAMDQGSAGRRWTVVSGSASEGGHYVPLVGHPVQDVWTCVSWGKRQTMTAAFLSTYCDEAWAYIDPERYAAVTGQTPEGFADVDLERYITLLSQQINSSSASSPTGA